MLRKRMVRFSVMGAFFLLLLLFIPWIVLADFIPTNGQAATRVLGQTDFESSAGATTQTGMFKPWGVAVDPKSHKVFVSEPNNNRVLRFASLASLTNGAAAEIVLGQEDFNHGLANRGDSVSANSMYFPTGVFVDAEGRLWLADSLNNRVLRFDNAATRTSGANADGVLGQTNFTSSTPALTRSGLNDPFDVFVTKSGQLWVADYLNNRVLRFDDAAAIPNGAEADGVLGQPDFLSNTSATTQNGMSEPNGVYEDSSGRLWISDWGNNRVLRYDNAAGKIGGDNADGVLGQSNYTSNDSACSLNGLSGPRDVSGDESWRVYVVDASNNRVLAFLEAGGLPPGANASFVLGQIDLSTCTSGAASASTLKTPAEVFYDPPTRVLWIADYSYNRVLMYGNPILRIYLPVVKK